MGVHTIWCVLSLLLLAGNVVCACLLLWLSPFESLALLSPAVLFVFSLRLSSLHILELVSLHRPIMRRGREN